MSTSNNAVNQATSYLTFEQFGAIGNGTTDDTTAITNAIAAAATANVGVIGTTGKTYLVNATAFQVTSSYPLFIQGNGSTLLAASGSTGSFVLIQNPQGSRNNFEFSGFNINANQLCSVGLEIHGCQCGIFRNINAYNSTGLGIKLNGASGFGIYYSLFENVRAGQPASVSGFTHLNGSSGWSIKSTGSANFIASNTLLNCTSIANKGFGYDIDWASNSYIGCEAELNDNIAFNIDNTLDSTFCGGYSESNDQGAASNGGTPSGGTDTSFQTTSNTTGFKVVGGRHIGILVGTLANRVGNLYLPTTSGITVDGSGNLILGSSASIAGGGSNSGGSNTFNWGGTAFPFELAGATIFQIETNNFHSFKPVIIQSAATIRSGTGSPSGTITGANGDIFLRTDGSTGSRFYVCSTGTTWAAVSGV